MRIPFIGGSDEGRSTPWNATRSINFFVEQGSQDGKSPTALIGTPGTVLFATFPAGPIRMFHVMVDRCFVVAGIDLYELYTDGTFSSSFGSFSGDADTPIVAVDNGISAFGVGGNQILILANGYGYIFNVLTGALGRVTDPNFPADVHQCAFLDGYFIVTSRTMAFRVSELYDGTVWPSLATAAAIAAADNIQKPFGTNQILYLVKDSTTEVWQNAGTATTLGSPFTHIPGSLVNFGTNADRSVARVGDTVFMLGTTRVQDSAVYFGVVSVSGTAIQKVSTPAIDYRISRLSSLSDAISYSYADEGHVFYVLTFPTDDITFVYDVTTQLWHERSTFLSGPYTQHRHLSNEYVFFGGKHLVSHYNEPKIFEMSTQYYSDNGDPIISIRTAQPLFDEDENENVKIFKLVVDAETGVGWAGEETGSVADTNVFADVLPEIWADDTGNVWQDTSSVVTAASLEHNRTPTAWLSWSNDGGRTWSSEYSSSLGRQGEYKTRLIWRRLGSPRNRIFRLKISDSVKKVLLSAMVNNGAKG